MTGPAQACGGCGGATLRPGSDGTAFVAHSEWCPALCDGVPVHASIGTGEPILLGTITLPPDAGPGAAERAGGEFLIEVGMTMLAAAGVTPVPSCMACRQPDGFDCAHFEWRADAPR